MKLIEMEKQLPHAEHAFGTALDGGSAEDVTKIVRSYTERMGAIAYMRQVHGDRIVYATEPGMHEECDAIFTDRQDLWLGITTADCAPVLISSPEAVAAVHCGWRGLHQEILPKTLKILMDDYNLSGADIFIHIGPCIRQENYEVEAYYADYFDEKFFKPSNKKGHVKMDLIAIVEEQAREMGVPLSHITDSGLCTYTERGILHSYRRQKEQNPDAPYQVQMSLVKREE